MANISGGADYEHGEAPSAWVWSQYRGMAPDAAPPRSDPAPTASAPKPVELRPAATAEAGPLGTGAPAPAEANKGGMAGPLVALAFVVAGIIFYALLPAAPPPVAPSPQAEAPPKVEAAPAPAVQSVPPTLPDSPATAPAEPSPAPAATPAPIPQRAAPHRKPQRRPHG